MSQARIPFHIGKWLIEFFDFGTSWRLPWSFNAHCRPIHYVIHLNAIISGPFHNRSLQLKTTHIFRVFRNVTVSRRITYLCCVFERCRSFWSRLKTKIIGIRNWQTAHTEVIEALRVWPNVAWGCLDLWLFYTNIT